MKPWIIVVIVLILILLLAAVAGVLLVWMVSQPISVSGTTVLEIPVGKPMTEGQSENPFELLFDSERLTVFDYWRLLDYAASDSRVKALSLEITPSQVSWAQVEELRESLIRFKESGKPVHAFLSVDLVGESEFYLASVADSITVNPDAAFLINGLVAEVTFFKRALDKLEIKPQFLQYKEFKSPEVWERESLSPPVREMYRSILEDLEGRFIQQIAGDRSLEPDQLRERMLSGMLTASQALEAGLVDTLGYRSSVRERLKEAAGSDMKLLAASKYFKANESKFDRSSRHRVAVVTGEGLITSGESDPFSQVLGGSSMAERLREIREDEDFDAVLLRVDSPGGSAVGSDMIWEEIRLLREAGRPVVVSMSGVAGSGGYYISMGANRIICHPSTITGSIGVIFGKFDLEGLFNWLGMSIDRVKLTSNADIFSSFTSLNEEQEAAVSHWMKDIYDTFVSKAAEGRGLAFEELESRARGRIYTGSQAKEIGLVDDLGGYSTALKHLRELMEVPESDEVQLVRYPRPKTFWEVLSEASLSSSTVQSPVPPWLKQEWANLTQAMPRLITPEARIY